MQVVNNMNKPVDVTNELTTDNMVIQRIHVAEGQSTNAHQHHELERFTIIQGAAQVTIDGEQFLVGVGDAIDIPKFSRHCVRNIFDKELVYQAIIWEENAIHDQVLLPKKPHLIITPSVTPNGDLHIGHISGPYLMADTLYRLYQQYQINVHHYKFLDDKQSYIHYLAQKEGVSSRSVIKENAAKIQASLAKMNITESTVSTQRCVDSITKNMLHRLISNGCVTKQTVEKYYCEACDRFCIEAFVSGECRYCSQECCGMICEKCYGFQNDNELRDAHCTACNQSVILKSTEVYVLNVNKILGELTHYLSVSKISTDIREFCLKRANNLEVHLSYPESVQSGVRIEFIESRFYSFVEIASRYIASVNKFDRENLSVTQCLGVDNRMIRLVIFPAMILAYDRQIKLPDAHYGNYFYLYNHQKFSTSRQHVVAVDDLLNEYSSDAIRYYLASNRATHQSKNFDRDEVRKYVCNNLQNPWLIICELVSSNFDKNADQQAQLWNDEQIKFEQIIRCIRENYQEEISFYPISLIRWCKHINALIEEIRIFCIAQRYIQNPRERSTCRFLLNNAFLLLAKIAYPIMPGFAEHIAYCFQLSITQLSNSEQSPNARLVHHLAYNFFSNEVNDE